MAVIAAQGFSEAGAEGAAREARVAAIAREKGVRLVGPNTDGVANFASGIVTSIQPLLGEGIPLGPVAIVAQSGATSASIITRLKAEGIGCRYAISTGNEADLGLADYLSLVVQDDAVEIVLCFVESIRKPKEFRAVARLAAELGKPICLMKVGASEQAARRTAAHTGSLAGDDAQYEALFRADGVLRVAEPSELVAVAKLYLGCGAPRSRGVGVVSVSGGGCSIVADKAVATGLEVPTLARAAEDEMNEILAFGGAFNPCDLTGEIAKKPELAGGIVAILGRQPEVDLVVYARKGLTGTVGEESALSLAQAAMQDGVAPLAVYALDGSVDRAEEAAVYGAHRIPVFGSLQDLFVAAERLAAWSAFCAAPRPAAAAVEPGGPLPADPWEVLAACGIARPRQERVHDLASAVAAAGGIRYPVVLKVEDARILHRSDIGGVAVGLRTAREVENAYASIEARARAVLGGEGPAAMLVQEQVEGGVELILGVDVDPLFGPFVLVGLGGVFTEALHDVALRPAPVDEGEAMAMLRGLRGAALLDGYRGAPAVDVDAVAKAITGLSTFAAEHVDSLAAIDINPLVVLPAGRGVRAVDVLVIPS
jgi:acyl-CoA synthetase (NDP forming)